MSAFIDYTCHFFFVWLKPMMMATTTTTATNGTNVETFVHQIILLFIRYGIISIIVSLLLLRSIRIIQRWLRSRSMICKFSGINVPFWKIPIGNIDMLFIGSWTTETIVDGKKKKFFAL